MSAGTAFRSLKPDTRTPATPPHGREPPRSGPGSVLIAYNMWITAGEEGPDGGPARGMLPRWPVRWPPSLRSPAVRSLGLPTARAPRSAST